MLETALTLVKDRLGLRSDVRNTYLTAIINSVIKELSDEKGLVLTETNPYHLMFVVDVASWRYQNRDSPNGMPRHLQYRLHNMMIHVGAKNLIVKYVVTVDQLPLTPNLETVYILSADNSQQMFIDNTWKIVTMKDGSWVVVE